MCGRYVIKSRLEIVEKRFGVKAEQPQLYHRSPNIAIGELAPVILNTDRSHLRFLHFGLTPFWAKKRMYIINARSEGNNNPSNDPHYTGGKGILQKPAFRRPIRSRRCLIIADAFLEGPKDEGLSRPYVFYPLSPREPFAMAGIWDSWQNPESGERYESFAIITTVANNLVAKIGHERSPVVLSRGEEHLWLEDNAPLGDITALLHPFDPSTFNAYPVSPKIKSPRAKDFELLKPTGPPLHPDVDYILYQDIELEGMGHTAARQRKSDRQEDQT